VYASEGFCELTGYTTSEIMGRNCRFLQAPGGDVRPKSKRKHVDRETIRKMRNAVEKDDEIQIEVVNFKKSGENFVNLLTMIPIRWNGDDHRYSVGFLVDRDAC
jgi:PAS domain S-box-containing protein